MDAIQVLDHLAKFRLIWETCPRGTLLHGSKNTGNDQLGFLTEMKHYQILLLVTIGKKMGVVEHLTVVDTREKATETEHLMVARDCRYDLASETWLDLPYDVVQKKKEGRPIFIETLKKWLQEEILDILTDPKKIEGMIKYFRHPDDMLRSSSSVLTVKFATTRT